MGDKDPGKKKEVPRGGGGGGSGTWNCYSTRHKEKPPEMLPRPLLLYSFLRPVHIFASPIHSGVNFASTLMGTHASPHLR